MTSSAVDGPTGTVGGSPAVTDVPSGERPDPPHPRVRLGPADRRAGAVAVLVLAFVSLLVPLVHMAVYERVSPIDEEAHIDYTLRAPALLPTRSGDLWLQQTMQETACRGKDRGRPARADCRTLVQDPRTFGQDGYPAAYVHPPTYYDVTALVGRALQRLFGLLSPVTGFRMVGVLWLFAGLLACYRTSRAFGADRLPTVALLCALVATPAVFYPASIVNPDAASLLVGGLVVGLVHRWDTRRSASPLLLVLAGAVAAGVKVQNGLVAVLMALYLLGLALWPLGGWLAGGRGGPPPTDGLRRRVAGVAVLGASVAAVAGAWSLVVTHTATLPPAQQPMALQYTVPRLPHGAMTGLVGRFVEPLTDQYVPEQYSSGWLTAATLSLTWLFVAAVIWPALFATNSRRLRVLAWTVLALGTLGPVLETYANFVVLHQYISMLSTRYALPLVPAFVVAASVAARSVGQRRAYVVLAVCSVTATTAVLATSAP